MSQVTEKPIAVEAQERKFEPITMTNISSAEFIRNIHCATIPHGTLPEDLLKPEYWAHVSNEFKAWGRIEARAEDGTWFGEYLITEVGRTWAKVFQLSLHKLSTHDVSLSQASPSLYEVKWRGPNAKWSVVRKSDSSVMKDGMERIEADICKTEFDTGKR
jgi:CubicO group peptidase (beta-lactamase class C family)